MFDFLAVYIPEIDTMLFLYTSNLFCSLNHVYEKTTTNKMSV